MGTTSTTGQRVHFVDTVNELSPSLAQSGSWRRSFIRLFLVFRGVVVSELLRTNAIGVGSVESDEMFMGFGNVYEHTSKELERVQGLVNVGVVAGFGLIDDELGFGMIAKAR